MAKPNISEIRRAIIANRGGHENTSDTGIMKVWQSLDEQTREKYIGASKAGETKAAGPAAALEAHKKGKKHALSAGAKRDVPGGPRE